METVLTVFLLTVAIAVGAAIVVGLWVGVFWVLAYLMDSLIDRKATKGGQNRTD